MQQCTSLFEKLAYKDLQLIKGILLLHDLPIHLSELCPFPCDFVKIICYCHEPGLHAGTQGAHSVTASSLPVSVEQTQH